jgi:hypothetical protein
MQSDKRSRAEKFPFVKTAPNLSSSHLEQVEQGSKNKSAFGIRYLFHWEYPSPQALHFSQELVLNRRKLQEPDQCLVFENVVWNRVARFFLIQHTKIAKIYQMTTKHTK